MRIGRKRLDAEAACRVRGHIRGHSECAPAGRQKAHPAAGTEACTAGFPLQGQGSEDSNAGTGCCQAVGAGQHPAGVHRAGGSSQGFQGDAATYHRVRWRSVPGSTKQNRIGDRRYTEPSRPVVPRHHAGPALRLQAPLDSPAHAKGVLPPYPAGAGSVHKRLQDPCVRDRLAAG